MGACPCGNIQIKPKNYQVKLIINESTPQIKRRVSSQNLGVSRYPCSFPGFAMSNLEKCADTNVFKNIIYDCDENQEFMTKLNEEKRKSKNESKKKKTTNDCRTLRFMPFSGEMLMPMKLKNGTVDIKLEKCEISELTSGRQIHPTNKIQLDRLMARLSGEDDYFVIDKWTKLEIVEEFQYLFIKFNFFNIEYGIPTFETEISLTNTEDESVDKIEAHFGIEPVYFGNISVEIDDRTVFFASVLNKIRRTPLEYIDLFFRTEANSLDVKRIDELSNKNIKLLRPNEKLQNEYFSLFKAFCSSRVKPKTNLKKELKDLKEKKTFMKLIDYSYKDLRSVACDLLRESKTNADLHELFFSLKYSKIACYFGENEKMKHFMLLVIR